MRLRAALLSFVLVGVGSPVAADPVCAGATVRLSGGVHEVPAVCVEVLPVVTWCFVETVLVAGTGVSVEVVLCLPIL